MQRQPGQRRGRAVSKRTFHCAPLIPPPPRARLDRRIGTEGQRQGDVVGPERTFAAAEVGDGASHPADPVQPAPREPARPQRGLEEVGRGAGQWA